jgi:hypothetical protein
MNPQRTYPLLVVLSKKTIQKIKQAGVEQRTGSPITVEKDSVVEIEPILPGCNCYPPKQKVRVGDETVTASFWVVPYVFGKVLGARIMITQNARQLSEIPLKIRVVNKTLAVMMGIIALVFPLISAAFKYFELDFEAQMNQGFVTYASIAQAVFTALSPEVWAISLFAATGLAYLFVRPRKRDMFWDIASDRLPELAFRKRVFQRLKSVVFTSGQYGLYGGIGSTVVGLLIVGVVAAASSITQALSVAPVLLGLFAAGGAVLGLIAGAFEGVGGETEN